MESADQAVAEVSIALAPSPNLIHYSVKPIIYTLFSQLNGSTVGDVPIKVSIARKQPMLEAATGKSVWATLGKYLESNTDQNNKQCDSVNSGFMYSLSPSCAEQRQRLLPRQEEPGCVQ